MTPGWLKPEYLLRPRQALRRVARALGARPTGEFAEARLPWGLPIRVRPGEVHGKAMLDLGIVDLAVTEVLWRLADPGETVADVGANIGCMSAVLAARVGSSGRVHAFEAHPAIFEELAFNVSLWEGLWNDSRVRAENVAISRESGSVSLSMPRGFETNRGLSRVPAPGEPADPGSLTVPAKRLDEVLGVEPVSVVKLDVEGHELAVLEGARDMLGAGRARDIVFEEHGGYPTPVTALLSGHGYRLLRIERSFRGVRLLAPDAVSPRSTWEPTSFLATRDPGRVSRRFRASGWQALGGWSSRAFA
jgi:FkbM family methyltransferase